ncbi:Na+/H+ antiporter NhaC [uncultured Anaerococcus sp.]|uniref:Na+/H+ antiporter NhaC n=1 Tax=uncultured Anaerococcus sp. TaxID=293428 RepID=UPI00280B3778|nr:Na+/H+ antiporter NhaC [uncultured Anaerococcus sp.]MDU5149014.1 Na+/H+ antiporter NhaC [Anaerococcus prevotii]
MQKKRVKNLSFMQAIFPILVMLVVLGIGVGGLGLPAEPLIVLATIIAGVQAILLGYSYDSIIEEISLKISKIWGALLILVIVGFMIGSWMIGGTIPMLIYYGLKLINPKYLALTAFLLTAIVSILTGTSWGSAGTIGVAFMGVAVGLDVNLAVIAGAVVSGAYFGDKLSPLSDTTNLASAVCEVNIYEHIANQMWTTGGSAIIAAIFYFIYGQFYITGSGQTPETVLALMKTLNEMFNWNIILIIPLLVVLIGSITKKPTIPVMLLASFIALFNAFIFQGASIDNIINATLNGFNVGMLGYDETAVIPDLVKLLHRGGMMAMMNTLLIAICAISFAGTMSVTGGLDTLISKLTEKISSTFQLVASTIVICLITTGVTSNGQVSILMPGEALKDVYKKKGLHPKVLSRTLEDSVSCTECLIPWTAAGAYMAATLGVPTLSYLPFAVLNYSGMILALIWAATGIGITKLKSK